MLINLTSEQTTIRFIKKMVDGCTNHKQAESCLHLANFYVEYFGKGKETLYAKGLHDHIDNKKNQLHDANALEEKL